MNTSSKSPNFVLPEIAVVDIYQSGMVLQTFKRKLLSDTQLRSMFCVRSARPPAPGKRSTYHSRLFPSKQLLSFEVGLEALATDCDLAHALIVLGANTDPLFPFEGKFDRTLKLLERLAQLGAGGVALQTCSSLVLLAVPVLKALSPQCAVTIALDAADDELSYSITPGTPRPSERLLAAKTLRDAGITTVIQAAPITTEEKLLQYAHSVRESCDFAIIADAYANRELCDGLRQILMRRCPERVLDHIAACGETAWHRSQAA